VFCPSGEMQIGFEYAERSRREAALLATAGGRGSFGRLGYGYGLAERRSTTVAARPFLPG